MNLSEGFLTALDSILANKLRSTLTMLGVIIGVAAVISLLAIGNGVTSDVESQISAIGTNLITIATNQDNSGGYPALGLSDLAALEQLSTTDGVAASTRGQQQVVYGGESMQTTVNGVTTNFLALNNLETFQLGDGLTEEDQQVQARVVVLGANAAATLFDTLYPVGQPVKINGVSYQVVGVLAESGGGFGSNTDDTLFMPLSTAQTRLYPARTRRGEKSVSTITVAVADAGMVDQTMSDITVALRQAHQIPYGGEEDFSLFSAASLLETFSTVSATLTAFLGAIAGISLVVGGIGIMNIMLVSVTERTREIGIRKAIGALRRDILAQFLLESMVLSLLGGVIGITLGWLVSTVAGSLLGIALRIEPGTVLLSTSFAAAVGLIFGIYPAWRASMLRPIEALRYE